MEKGFNTRNMITYGPDAVNHEPVYTPKTFVCSMFTFPTHIPLTIIFSCKSLCWQRVHNFTNLAYIMWPSASVYRYARLIIKSVFVRGASHQQAKYDLRIKKKLEIKKKSCYSFK